MKFNINDYVLVKLTDKGRHVLQIQKTPYKEDSNGWSRWQMWHLMSEFGPHIYLGCAPCFETNIKIENTK